MKKKLIRIISVASLSLAAFSMSACSFFGSSETSSESKDNADSTAKAEDKASLPDRIEGLEFEKELALENAKEFSIDCYKDGFYAIKLHNNSQQILVVPEGKQAPEGIDNNIVVLQQPVQNMKIDLISLISLMERINPDSVDKVKLVALNKEDVVLDRVAENMDKGVTEFAGTYNSPNVSIIEKTNPQLFIANPSLEKKSVYKELVKEEINPVFSYIHHEETPLARLEWIKFMGVILGDLPAAEDYYNKQKQLASEVDKSKAGEKTYIIFCCNKDENKVSVRRAGDQVARIGEMAGGKNMMTDTANNSWEEMTIEDFEKRFKDTDYLIYMNKRDDNIESVEDFKKIVKSAPDFKAVKDGNLWKTYTDFVKSMDNVGEIAQELNGIFAGDQAVIDKAVNFIHLK